MKELFRFTAIRTINHSLNTGTVNEPANLMASELAQAVASAENQKQKLGIASNFLKSDRAVKYAEAFECAYAQIVKQFEYLRPGDPGEAEEIIIEVTGKPPKEIASEAEHQSFRNRLSDTILALLVLRVRGSYIAQCVILLRIVTLIDAFITGGNSLKRSLRQVGKYVVAIPRELIEKKDPDQGVIARRISGRMKTASQLREQLVQLQAAYRDIAMTIEVSPFLESSPEDDDPKPHNGKGKEDQKLIAHAKDDEPGEPFLRLKRSSLAEASSHVLDNLGIVGDLLDGPSTLIQLKHEIAVRGAQFHLLLAGQKKSGQALARRGGIGSYSLLSLPGGGTMLDFASLQLPADDAPADPMVPPKGEHGTARVLGIGELMRVEETFLGCQLGELAGIINIPRGSVKQLEITRRESTETQTESEQVQETSTEETTETSERTNLTSECEQVISADLSLEAGMKVSASYGPTVGVEASSNFSTSVSSSETSSSAYSYAKDVTERAVKRASSKTRVAKKTLVNTEREQKETEGYTNQSETHTVGIYRWVNEIFHARLVNYGARLLLEFMVPEPGHLLHYMSGTPLPPGPGEPTAPPPFDVTPEDIYLDNYLALVAEYGASDVPAPPSDYLAVSKAFTIGAEGIKKGERANLAFANHELTIPDGYEGKKLWGRLGCSHNDIDGHEGGRVRLLIQGVSIQISGRTKSFERNPLNRGNIPISLTGYEDRAFVLNVIVRCKATPEVWQKWKLDVFTKLKQGYEQKVSEYQDALREFRRRPGITVASGSNPQTNRERENEELKRSCISILTRQNFKLFDAVYDPGDQIPTIDFDQAKTEGDYIRFFEWAFEWPQMTFVLYPYFWANPTKTWQRSLSVSDSDPKHEEFLRAGAARVVVPVRPEYQRAMLHYLSYGVTWDGHDPDEISILDPAYVPVYTEIMERQGQLEQDPVVVQEWDLTVPTSHQIIANGTVLPQPPFLP